MTDKQVREIDRVIIRFAGDSGDGMQLTGSRFTSETALLGEIGRASCRERVYLCV